MLGCVRLGRLGCVRQARLPPAASLAAPSTIPKQKVRYASHHESCLRLHPRPRLQSQIPFAQSRVDTARIARRKAATEAIKARMYAPPSAPPLAPQTQRPTAPGQQSLFSFGFTKAPAAGGPEEMDMS